jgi:hypothetical protein
VDGNQKKELNVILCTFLLRAGKLASRADFRMGENRRQLWLVPQQELRLPGESNGYWSGFSSGGYLVINVDK